MVQQHIHLVLGCACLWHGEVDLVRYKFTLGRHLENEEEGFDFCDVACDVVVKVGLG
jgi:hypothetical protein